MTAWWRPPRSTIGEVTSRGSSALEGKTKLSAVVAGWFAFAFQDWEHVFRCVWGNYRKRLRVLYSQKAGSSSSIWENWGRPCNNALLLPWVPMSYSHSVMIKNSADMTRVCQSSKCKWQMKSFKKSPILDFNALFIPRGKACLWLASPSLYIKYSKHFDIAATQGSCWGLWKKNVFQKKPNFVLWPVKFSLFLGWVIRFGIYVQQNFKF